MNLSKPKHEKLILKKCAHEGCEKNFYTKKPAEKYCEEHKKRTYYKGKTEDPNNNTIEHEYKFPTNTKLVCELCGKPFEFLIIPTVKKIPKYCEEHRNEYKRQLYLKNKI